MASDQTRSSAIPGDVAGPLLVLWSPLPGGGALGVALDATPVVIREREALRRTDEFYAAVAHELRTPLTRILGWVRCAVSDTGVGLAAEALARLFDLPPAGLRRADGGLGVALGIAHSLAAAQGGRLQAESDGPGRGARFTLCLPFAETA